MLEDFGAFETRETDGQFSIIHGEKSFTFYTARSGSRDLAYLREQLAAAESTVLFIAPYHDALEGLFEEERRFFFLAPASFSKREPKDERFIATDRALERFINSVDSEDKFTVCISPQWRELHAILEATMHRIFERIAVRLKTLKHFARLWAINFRANHPLVCTIPDILKMRGVCPPPDALVMAGPSLDHALSTLKNHKQIWCADTALPVLMHYGIAVDAVFSLDAGFASREHFVKRGKYHNAWPRYLVCDLLASPLVLRLSFKNKFIYQSSHPLVQEFCAYERADLTIVSNKEGNVGGLMQSVCAQLFPDAKPRILGHDRGHVRHITHARGTAYFQRGFIAHTRLATVENYMHRLSARYGATRNRDESAPPSIYLREAK